MYFFVVDFNRNVNNFSIVFLVIEKYVDLCLNVIVIVRKENQMLDFYVVVNIERKLFLDLLDVK